MSGPTAALTVLAELRKTDAEAAARDLVRAEAELSAARQALARAETELRREQATGRANVAGERQHLQLGGARVADLVRQQAYLDRLEGELAKLRGVCDEARRTWARAGEAERRSRQRLARAWGEQRAVERRVSELERDAARRVERGQEEDADGQVIARWSDTGRRM